MNSSSGSSGTTAPPISIWRRPSARSPSCWPDDMPNCGPSVALGPRCAPCSSLVRVTWRCSVTVPSVVLASINCWLATRFLVVEATRVGADTQLSQIARLVEAAQAGKAGVQRLADRISAIFVPIVIAIAVATLGFWLGQGSGLEFAFTAAVAVVIIACPCALGLATPTALMVGTGRGAQLGILIKGPEVLESTRKVDTVVLDKTGTVTTGKMALVEVAVADGVDRREVLRLVGALENASEHPIAQAIANAAQAENGALPAVES